VLVSNSQFAALGSPVIRN